MKPLLTTARVLSEFAAGLPIDAASRSPILFQFDGPDATVILSHEDTQDSQRVIVVREESLADGFLPEHLRHVRSDALARMASFVERARSVPLSLPRGWHQFKKDNLITFFAVAGGDSNSTRWVAELRPGTPDEIVFWRTTTSGKHADLDEFSQEKPALPDTGRDWIEAFEQASQHFREARRGERTDVDMYLPTVPQGSHRQRTFEEWLSAVSDDQRAFIDAPTDRSIRLRGPAGSGKTLALTLKALKEVRRSEEAGEPLRALLVTQSWALATQIDTSISLMGADPLRRLDVLPLLEVAQAILPTQRTGTAGFSLIGEDSLSSKQAQLDQIVDVVDDFVAGDWLTYRGEASESLRIRMDSDDPDVRFALAWDLLVEFGSVLGAAAIFPGVGSELRYAQLNRARWMLPLDGAGDRRVVFRLYERYMQNLEERSLETSDQLLADFLNYLETHAWNRSRKSDGYDLVFVDEFHLFGPLERQVLHYLTRDVASYPRIFMAVDPRQSPSEAFIGTASDETRSLVSGSSQDDALDEYQNFELTTVHRFTPQILELVKHVHHTFPALELGDEWDVDFSMVESSQTDGPVPILIPSASRDGELNEIYKSVQELYSKGRVALAVVDVRAWRRYAEFAFNIGTSGRYHVSAITGRSDIEGIGYRKKGLVVGAAEYLAGLQFDAVLVAGVPDLRAGVSASNEKTRVMSLLYLALSRAEREVRVFVNDDDGGSAEVLTQAVEKGIMNLQQGSLV